MDKPYVISYSRIDGREFSSRLLNELRAGPIPVAVWHDEAMGIRASSIGWPEQLDEVLKICAGVLFVVTGDSVKERSVVADELYTARMYRKTIIPVMAESGVTAPFLYRRLHAVSFAGDFDRGLADLRRRLAWLETAEGRISSLEFQRASVERELTRDLDDAEQTKIRVELQAIDDQIRQLRHAADEPRQAEQERKRKIDQAIERESQRQVPEAAATVLVVNRPPASPPLRFLDRIAETRVVGQFVCDPSKRVMTITGRGGVGKTAMVCRILGAIEHGESAELLDADVPVSGIVYLGSGSDKTISFENFHAALCRLLPESAGQSVDTVWTSARDLRTQTDALVSRFTQHPVIVLFDNFEDQLDPHTQRIANADVQQLLEALLELPQHAVKVIVTTRETPAGLSLHRPERQMFVPLDEGLKSPYAEDLLRSLDTDGRLGLRSAPDTVLNEIRDRTLGIPRALEIFCAILNDPYTSLREVLSDTRRYLPAEVVNKLSVEAFSRLDRTAQRVVEVLAVFGRPVIPEAVDFVLQPYEPATLSEPTLRRLVGMYLVRRHSGRCFLHPVDQDYARSRIPAGPPSDLAADDAYTIRNLNGRAAEYFHLIRTDESTWRSLSDLGPQLAEFDLLIAAGRYDQAVEVLDSILTCLDSWGYKRQIARMAEQLRERTAGEVRARVAAVAGDAYNSLEYSELAAARYEEALAEGHTLDPTVRGWWTLKLASAYRGNDATAAARLFNTCLDQASDEQPELRVQALIGLGGIAMNRSDRETAEILYFRALDSYVPSLGVNLNEVEGKTLELTPIETPGGLATTDASAWHYLDTLIPTDNDPDAVRDPVVLFGVGTSSSFSSDAASADADTDQTIEVFPLQVNVTLAGIWLSLSQLYFKWDRMAEAKAASILAANMYVQLKDDEGTLDAINSLASVEMNFSRTGIDELIENLQPLLDRARASGNLALTARILLVVGEAYLNRDQPAEAEHSYSEARRLSVEVEDVAVTIEADLGLARALRKRGEDQAALERLEPATHLLRPNQMNLRARIHSELGEIAVARYEYETAAGHFDVAANAYESDKDVLSHTAMQRRLAALDIADRRYPVAIRRLERALVASRSTEIPSEIASALSDLAEAYSAGGDRARAIASAEEAVQITEQIDLPYARAAILLTLAKVLCKQRQFAAAMKTCAEVRTIYKTLKDIGGEIQALQALANVCSETRDVAAQLSAAREAAQLARALADPEDRRQARMSVALALAEASSCQEAVELMEGVVNDRPTDAAAIGNFGWILYLAGQYERSVAESQRALAMDPSQAFVIRNIGHAYLAMRKPDDAEDAYRRAIRDRRGGEDFLETIRCVQDLLARDGALPRAQEMLALLEDAQREIEKGWQTDVSERHSGA